MLPTAMAGVHGSSPGSGGSGGPPITPAGSASVGVLPNSTNGPFGTPGSVVAATGAPEIDEMLSAVSTSALELHELESLVLDDNQQLFGQEVALSADVLSSSDQQQLIQLDHCYAQSPSADPAPTSAGPASPSSDLTATTITAQPPHVTLLNSTQTSMPSGSNLFDQNRGGNGDVSNGSQNKLANRTGALKRTSSVALFECSEDNSSSSHVSLSTPPKHSRHQHLHQQTMQLQPEQTLQRPASPLRRLSPLRAHQNSPVSSPSSGTASTAVFDQPSNTAVDLPAGAGQVDLVANKEPEAISDDQNSAAIDVGHDIPESFHQEPNDRQDLSHTSLPGETSEESTLRLQIQHLQKKEHKNAREFHQMSPQPSFHQKSLHKHQQKHKRSLQPLQQCSDHQAESQEPINEMSVASSKQERTKQGPSSRIEHKSHRSKIEPDRLTQCSFSDNVETHNNCTADPVTSAVSSDEPESFKHSVNVENERNSHSTGCRRRSSDPLPTDSEMASLRSSASFMKEEVASTLENALTPQELDAVSAAVAKLHSGGDFAVSAAAAAAGGPVSAAGSFSTATANSTVPDDAADTPPVPESQNGSGASVCSTIAPDLADSGAFPQSAEYPSAAAVTSRSNHVVVPCVDPASTAPKMLSSVQQRLVTFPKTKANAKSAKSKYEAPQPLPSLSARPSRKSKEKFQRNLERKRQMGKNIEDYVSDESDGETGSLVALTNRKTTLSAAGATANKTTVQGQQQRRGGTSNNTSRQKQVPPPRTDDTPAHGRTLASEQLGKHHPLQSRRHQGQHVLKEQMTAKNDSNVGVSSGRPLCSNRGRPPNKRKAAPLKVRGRKRRSSTAQSTRAVDSSDADGASVKAAGDDGDDDHDDWNSDNDPEKLWCICRKPHNNQFMIACDSCENWFHGKCVGVTKAEGARMEKAEQDWFCQNCSRKRNGQSSTASTTTNAAANAAASTTRGHAPTSSRRSPVLRDTSSTSAAPPATNMPLQSSTDSAGATSATPAAALRRGESGASVVDSITPHLPSTIVGNYTVLGQCAFCKQAIPGDASHRFCGSSCASGHVNKYLPAIMERADREGLEVRVSMVEISTGKAINLVNATIDGTEKWLCRKPSFQINPNQASAIRRPVPKSRPTRPSSTGQQRQQPSSSIAKPEAASDASIPPASAVSGTKHSQKVSASVATLRSATSSSSSPDCEKPTGRRAGHLQPASTTPKGVASSTGNLNNGDNIIEGATSTASAAEAASCPAGGSTASTLPLRNLPLTHARKSDPKVVAKKSSPVPSPTSASAGTVASKTRTERRKNSSGDFSKSTPASSTTNTSPAGGAANTAGNSNQAADDNEIRRNGVNALTRIIQERCEKDPSIFADTANGKAKSVPTDAAFSLAENIEKALWLLCGGVTKNYRVRFRSLCYNMKDQKNELWRRVVNGEIEPSKLVRMGPDELSTEMARWRERAFQHNLELYKKEAAINVTDKDALRLLADATPLVDETSKDKKVKKEDSEERKLTDITKDNANPKDNALLASDDRKRRRNSRERVGRNCRGIDTDKQRTSSTRNSNQQYPQLRDKRKLCEEVGGSNQFHRSASRSCSGRRSSRDRREKKTSASFEDKLETRSNSPDKVQKKSDNVNGKKELPGTRRRHNESSRMDVSATGPVSRRLAEESEKRQLDRAQRIIDQVRAYERRASSGGKTGQALTLEGSQSEDASLEELRVFSTKKSDKHSPELLNQSIESGDSPVSFHSVWNGIVRMDPAFFSANLTHMAGPASTHYEACLSDTLVICGNIQPASVRDYLTRLKHANKDIVIVRVTAESGSSSNHQDELMDVNRMLRARNRLGVVQEMKNTNIKDFYMLPLDGGESPPDWFPYVSRLGTWHNACLLGLIVCHTSSSTSRRGSSRGSARSVVVTADAPSDATGCANTPTPTPSPSSYQPSSVSRRVDMGSIEEAERMLAERTRRLRQGSEGVSQPMHTSTKTSQRRAISNALSSNSVGAAAAAAAAESSLSMLSSIAAQQESSSQRKTASTGEANEETSTAADEAYDPELEWA